MAYVHLPLVKALLLDAYGLHQDVTNLDCFEIHDDDVLLLKFDMTNVANIHPESKAVFYVQTYDPNSDSHTASISIIGNLTGDFNDNTYYGTKPGYTALYDGYYGKTAGNKFEFVNDAFKTMQYGLCITGARGYFSIDDILLTNTERTTTVTVSGSNVETDNFAVNFAIPLATNYTLKAVQNGITLATKTGTKAYNDSTPTQVTFTPNELNVNSLSNITFTLDAWGKYGGAVYIYAASTVLTSLTCIQPTVLTLEPDSITQNKDSNINVYWTSTEQDSFSVVVDGKTYTGTTATNITIPSGTIKILGTKTVALTVNRVTPWGQTITTSKIVSFTAVGTPSTPILDAYEYYSIATPTFNWTCADAYVAYNVQILQGTTVVEDSGEIISTDTSYICTTTLLNNTAYTVKIKIKTQYGYWSEWGSKTFITNFAVANKPSVTVYTTDNSVIVSSETVYSAEFANAELWRRTEYTEWVRIAYNLDNSFTYQDNFVGAEKYYYKARSISTTGGVNDSEVVNASISIANFNFANLEDIDNNIELIGNPSISVTENRQTATNVYAGCFAPIVDIGEVNYKTGSASFNVDLDTYNRFISMLKQAKVLLYRDRRCEKIYCSVVGNISKKYIEGDRYSISFSFVEVPFLEKDMYSGEGNLPLAFFDGTWLFDGSILFDGEGA